MLPASVLSKISAIQVDVFTIAAGVLLLVAVIYFFAVVKPVFDSNRRVSRGVQRMIERDRISKAYSGRTKVNTTPKSIKNSGKHPQGRGYDYRKQTHMGYQIYLKRNQRYHDNKQLIKHSRYKKIVSSKPRVRV